MNENPTGSVELQIDKLVTGGRGLGRHDGEAVFVPLTAPGDRVRVNLLKRHRGYRDGELLDVIEPGAGRREAPCPHYGDCGGCDLQHLDDQTQDQARRAILLDCFTRLGRLDVTDRLEATAPGPVTGYRNKLRLSQHPGGHYGLKRRGSGDVVPLEQCLVMGEPFHEHILPWLRFLPPVEQIVVRLDGRGGWLLSLYGPSQRAKLLKSILAETPEGETPAPGLQGVLLNNRPLWGHSYLVMEVAGHRYRVSHNSFFQGNLAAAEQVLATVRAWLDDDPDATAGGDLADLFGGVGLFALGLADRFQRVLSVDSDQSSVQDARENVRRDPVAQGRVTIRDGLVQAALNDPEMPGLLDWPRACVLVDPPRTGLGKRVIASLGELGPRTIFYVSCDPATLARDCAALGEAGYGVARRRLLPMFPQTAHLETLVQLRRTPTEP